MNSIFSLTSESVIYVVCPANNKTGGTELLHQLVYSLNDSGRKAYITYYFEGKSQKQDPTPEEFKKYVQNSKKINEVEDDEHNVLVLPEVCIGKHRNFKKIQKCVWWLSVDNYHMTFGRLNRLKRYGFMSFAKHLFLNDYATDNDISLIPVHLYQSYFAADFLRSKGVKNDSMRYLSDYINDIYTGKFEISAKENIVIYNPKKGFQYTQQLIDSAPQFKWVPIQNMTNVEVRQLMDRAKVYIDFGNHPGKDRIPREAAMSGCCVITNRRGSAGYAQDVPIPEKYKFQDSTGNVEKVVDLIQNCFENFDDTVQEFAPYRKFISAEKKQFAKDVREVF